ncbi:MAG: DNA repair protein RecN [Nitrospirota bacterium]
MLRELRLRHYTIIDTLSISFSSGLSVITGETGAGKSILIEALSLLLGKRADSDLVRHGADEAILEGLFDSPSIPSDLYENDPDGLIIKRVLSPSKGRAYFNGAFVPLSALKQVGHSLAEIHGQNDQHQLLNPDYLLLTLDSYGRLLEKKEQYQTRFKAYSRLIHDIAALKKTLCEDTGGDSAARRKDFISYQLSEIKDAALHPDEAESLEKEENDFKNRETILSCTDAGYQTLSDEGGVLSQIGGIEQSLRVLEATTKDTEAEANLLDIAKINLKELALLLRDRSQRVPFDPTRHQVVIERLYLIQKMKKKYGDSIEAILDFQQKLETELTQLSERESALPEMEQALEKMTIEITREAETLSKARNKVIGQFEKKVREELNLLGMDKTLFQISNQQKPLAEDGMDYISFLITLPGEALKPIEKVASGGELSRLMLAFKVALAEVDPVPTFVFDEIDAGIGGAIAERIGKRLFKLSKSHQVFCITHLPQIARFADHHYLVEKKMTGNRIEAVTRKLDEDERVLELARMLGGVELTPATLRHAQEMGMSKPSDA